MYVRTKVERDVTRALASPGPERAHKKRQRNQDLWFSLICHIYNIYIYMCCVVTDPTSDRSGGGDSQVEVR